MSTDTPEFWNEIWADIEDCGSGSDEILVDQVKHLTPGRALDIGCGTGGNAIWLATQGWQGRPWTTQRSPSKRASDLQPNEG